MIKEARKIIAKYCVEGCDADCCKRGSLKTSKKKALLIGGGFTKVNKKYKVELNPCPSLKDNLCSIYNNRPNTCKNFPIRKAMLGEEEIVVINECRAVESGLIDGIIEKLSLKYKIIR